MMPFRRSGDERQAASILRGQCSRYTGFPLACYYCISTSEISMIKPVEQVGSCGSMRVKGLNRGLRHF